MLPHAGQAGDGDGDGDGDGGGDGDGDYDNLILTSPPLKSVSAVLTLLQEKLRRW